MTVGAIMKTDIIIFARLTEGSRLRYRRTLDGLLPKGCEFYYDAAPDGSLDEPCWQLIEKRRFFDLETSTLHVWFDMAVSEIDGQDIPFDPAYWNFEKVC